MTIEFFYAANGEVICRNTAGLIFFLYRHPVIKRSKAAEAAQQAPGREKSSARFA